MKNVRKEWCGNEEFESTLVPLRIKNQLNCDGGVALAKESHTNAKRMCLVNTIAANTAPVCIFRLDFICEFPNSKNKCGQAASLVR